MLLVSISTYAQRNDLKQIFYIVIAIRIVGDSTVGKTAIVQTYLSSGLKYPNKYNMVGGVFIYMMIISDLVAMIHTK